MKKLFIILMAILTLTSLVACTGGNNPPETPPTPDDDKPIEYLALIRADETIDLKGVLNAIYEKDGKMMSVMGDENLPIRGEIVFGDADRDVSREAGEYLESLVAKESDPKNSTGFVIYKDKTGNVAVVWRDKFSKNLALDSFLSDYSSVSVLSALLPGEIYANVFNIDKYLAKTQWQNIEQTAPAEVTAALKMLYNYFDGSAIADWLANLWEPYVCVCGNCEAEGKEIACYGGAFYYANSARDYKGFLPDVESTSQALGLLNSLGVFENYGGTWVNAIAEVPGMKEKLITFCQQLQDKDSGYFYHPQWGSNVGAARRGRDLGWATGILSNLGAKPLYQTALERLEGSQTSFNLTRPLTNSATSAVSAVIPTGEFEDSLVSEEKYMQWLVKTTNGDDMFKNSSGAHTIASVATQIVAAGYLEITLDYLDAKAEELYTEMKAAYDADPENNPKPTGLWQRTADYNAVWGVLKLEVVYSHGNRPFKYHEDMMRTCIQVIMMDADEGGNYHMNDVWNQWASCLRIINNAKKHNPTIVDHLYEMAKENAPKMIQNTIEKLDKFIQDDGTYGYNQGTSAPTTQGVPVSLGMPEGDVNATALAHSTYSDVFNVLGYTRVKPCDYRDGERVLETLRNLTSVEKIEGGNSDPITFDDEAVLGMTASFSSAGEHSIVADPKNPDNNVLQIVTMNPGGDTISFRPYGNAVASNCFVFEADYCLIAKNREYLFQISMGDSYMIDLLYKGGKVTFRDNATTANASDTTPINASANLGEWLNLRIEYYTHPTNPTIKIYSDGNLVTVSHNFYGSTTDSAKPSNTFASLKVYAMNASEATLLLDNVYAACETKQLVDEKPTEKPTTSKTYKYDFEGTKPLMPIFDTKNDDKYLVVTDPTNPANKVVCVDTSRTADATYGTTLEATLADSAPYTATKGVSLDMYIPLHGDINGNGISGELVGDYFTDGGFPVLYQFDMYHGGAVIFRIGVQIVKDANGIANGFQLMTDGGKNGREVIDNVFTLDAFHKIKITFESSGGQYTAIKIWVDGTLIATSTNFYANAGYRETGDVLIKIFALKRALGPVYFDNIEYVSQNN